MNRPRLSLRVRITPASVTVGALALAVSVGAVVSGVASAAAPARIHEIQGSAHVSPLAGQEVSKVPGVVTGVGERGYWMQDPQPDSDPATSEALFVFTDTAPTVKVGDNVEVNGSVTEFRPGGKDTNNLAGTQVTQSAVKVRKRKRFAVPDPTVIGTGGRVPPNQVIDDDANGDVEQGGSFEPETDGVDFYESLEGMRVQVNNAVAVGPRNGFGEIPVLADGGEGAGVRIARGGIVLRSDDFNPERLIIDDVLAQTPPTDVGDVFPTPVVGVLDYAFGNFKVQVSESPQVERKNLEKEVAAEPGQGELSIATFNVENLDAADPQEKVDALAKSVVENLRSPDLINVEEIQDNNGATDDGTVADDQTVAKLVEAIKAAGGPAYEWRSIAPENNKDGGEPGGNIRVGFLFRTDRGLAFVDKPGGDATTPVDVAPDGSLTASPGRIDPGNAAFENSRKPLAGEFTWNGERLIVIANHWNSKGGDDPLFGKMQPPNRSSEEQRTAQAKAVAAFVAKAGDNVVVAGDLNDFDFSAAVKHLTDAGLTDLPAELPDEERYGYVFEGNSQVLDHILIGKGLAARPHAYDVVHINAEFADQTSDHDPSVVRIGS
jgi:uncharacterized protein